MNPNPNPNLNLNITKNDVEKVTCTCGCDAFNLLYKIGKINAFKSPTGKDTYIHMPIYVCVDCGEILDTAGETKKTEEAPKKEESKIII